jgi:hypothetical protein
VMKGHEIALSSVTDFKSVFAYVTSIDRASSAKYHAMLLHECS